MPPPTYHNLFSGKDSWRLVLMLMICILISLSGWLRIKSTLSSYAYLIEIGLSPHPLFLILWGSVVGLLFLAAILFLLLNRKWALTYLRWSAALYLALLLTENLFFSSAGNRSNITSQVIPAILGIGLWLLSRPSRLKETHHAHRRVS